jgi:hypothetical protein
MRLPSMEAVLLNRAESRQDWEQHQRGLDPDVKPDAVGGATPRRDRHRTVAVGVARLKPSRYIRPTAILATCFN